MQITHIKRTQLLLVSALVLLLAGCGGREIAGTATPAAGTPAATTPTAAASITLVLTDSTGATVNSISTTSPTTATATVKDANGAAVGNTVVTFTTDAALAVMTPAGGTSLTDAAGVATVALSPASISSSGAATITATAQVGSASATNTIGYSIGATSLTISAPVFGVGTASLSAFGTTSVSVTVSSGGSPITTPQTVNFTSPCSTSGKAALSSVSTVSGVATGSYRDIGCAGNDTVTASVNGGLASSSSTLTITSPTTGAIQFISATPASLSLAGTGGATTSQVAFKVVDGGGNPLSGKVVTFALDVTTGGITLTPAAPSTATSDNSGMVFANVNAGTMSTPVRVTASTPGVGTTVLTTQSSALTITTGIPEQSSFSLSATTLNIEGLEHDGITSILTVRLADHFKNPPPVGTSVNFVAEGARVGASCSTNAAGDCSVTFTSQNFRPADGRVTVLAYAVGEESFVDLDANGVANTAAEIAGPAGADLPEAWTDYNENGLYDSATEPYTPFNTNGAYDAADGLYNGVLCNATATPALCAAVKSVHVRGDIVIVLSGSTPVVTSDAPAQIDLLGCGVVQLVNVKIVDVNGNLMPAGTTVAFSTLNDGTIVTTTGDFPVANANTAIATIPAFNYSVTIKSDGAFNTTTGVCTDSTLAGVLRVTVTTPKGIANTAEIAKLAN